MRSDLVYQWELGLIFPRKRIFHGDKPRHRGLAIRLPELAFHGVVFTNLEARRALTLVCNPKIGLCYDLQYERKV